MKSILLDMYDNVTQIANTETFFFENVVWEQQLNWWIWLAR